MYKITLMIEGAEGTKVKEWIIAQTEKEAIESAKSKYNPKVYTLQSITKL